jgi:uncharacterized protein
LALKPVRFDVQLEPGTLDFLDPKIRQKGVLRASGEASLASEMLAEIRVKGHVEVDMEADCDRCLEPAAFPVVSDFVLLYRPMEEGMGDEHPVEPDEAEMGFYEGESVELNDVLREHVLLALPMQRLCSESCNGICPVCGQNRNQQPCECQSEAVADRWAALKQLK